MLGARCSVDASGCRFYFTLHQEDSRADSFFCHFPTYKSLAPPTSRFTGSVCKDTFITFISFLSTVSLKSLYCYTEFNKSLLLVDAFFLEWTRDLHVRKPCAFLLALV